jgi:hypothetical protein
MEEKITINGITYVKEGTAVNLAVNTDGKDYCLIRGRDSGVFAGYVESVSEDGKQVVLLNARRLWYWDGAASLSQLAMEGVSKPENCKFPCEMAKVRITDVIEIINATDEAKASISEVAVWKA